MVMMIVGSCDTGRKSTDVSFVLESSLFVLESAAGETPTQRRHCLVGMIPRRNRVHCSVLVDFLGDKEIPNISHCQQLTTATNQLSVDQSSFCVTPPCYLCLLVAILGTNRIN